MTLPFFIGSAVLGATAGVSAVVAAAIARRGEKEYEQLRSGIPLMNSIADLTFEIEELKAKQVALTAMVQRYEELEKRLPGLERSVSDLEVKKLQLLPMEEDHRQLSVKIAERKRSLDEAEARFAEIERLVAEGQAKVESDRQELTELQTDRTIAERHRDDARSEATLLRTEVDAMKVLLAQKSKELTALESRLSTKAAELAQVQASLAASNAAVAANTLTLKALATKQESLNEAIATAQQAKRKLEADLINLEARKAALLQDIERIEREIKRLQDEKARVGATVDSLLEHLKGIQSAGVAGAFTFAQAFASVANPVLDRREQEQKFATEEKAIALVQQHATSLGFQYSDRVIRAFHTSLKLGRHAPLLVLAGISGTGKSQLPRLYSDALGIHFLSMAVQPGWDSGADLVGFFSHIERKFKPTPLARALLQMDNYLAKSVAVLDPKIREAFAKPVVHIPEQMLLVLLDEMNLARVEYYFSDFLSRLEMRNSSGFDPEEVAKRARAQITLDAPNAQGGLDGLPLYPGDNVLFVGTMNEDESTMSLSDKVIDRANVLRFGKPTKLKTATEGTARAEATGYLGVVAWRAWCSRSSPAKRDAEVRDITKWLERLNEGLDASQRAFAHRTAGAIQAYCLSYPARPQERGAQDAMGALKTAFADQIEQRVMPKLRGLDPSSTGGGETIRIITQIVQDLNDAELLSAIEHGREANDGQSFVWYGVSRSVNA